MVTLPATGQMGIGRGYTASSYLYPDGPISAQGIFDESAALVREVDYAYGLEGEPLSVSGSTANAFAKTYDALYRIKTLADGNGNTTSYTYDSVGNLSQVSYPGGDTVQFPSYDPSGLLLQRIDGNGVTTNYVYTDPEGMLTDIQYPASTARNAHFTYDGYGRRSGKTDITGSQSYSYGDLDQLLSVSTTYTGLAAKTISYSYYDNGSRAGMTTPVGSFSYSYDAAGRPVSLTNPFSETTSWAYLNNDWLGAQTLNNGVVTTYTQNALGQLTGLRNASGTTTLSEFNGIVHDGAGNRLSVTANLLTVPSFSGTTTYQYDTKDQLTQESSSRAGTYTNGFGYDAAGNPTTFKGASRSYNTKNQRTSGTSFVYDGNGNPTTYNGTSLTFDPENKATIFGTAMTAGYTIEGLRAWKTSTATGTQTYFLYDGTTPVVELDATGAVSATNTVGANGLVSRNTFAGSVFYTFDERGTTAQRLGGSATVLSSHMADAFGTMASTLTGASTDPYDGFGAQLGYYSDHETGLVLCTYRYYDPTNGRWLNQDPIDYAGGMNLYGYVTNNPISAVDPSGLARVEVHYRPVYEFHPFPFDPGSTGYTIGVYHAYIVVIDEDGKSYFISGGPPDTDLPENIRIKRKNSIPGMLTVRTGRYNNSSQCYDRERGNDTDANRPSPTVLVDDDKPAWRYMKKFEAVGKRINQARITYVPVKIYPILSGENSNATVRTIIELSGTGLKAPTDWLWTC